MHLQLLLQVTFARILSVAVMVLLLAEPPLARAHPGLDERIAQVNAQLAQEPQNPELLLQRAELHRQHGQFDAALGDLNAAARLKPVASVVKLAQARVFSDAGQTTNALASIQQFLAKEPSHPEALVIRARCRMKLGQVEAAIADFTLALTKSKTPEPDFLLERARAQAAAGQLANAVSGLDEGMARIGAVVPLQLAAIEYDRQRADFAAALARVGKLLANQPVKQPWQVLRGEILAQSGQLNEARAVFKQSLDGIEKYPPVRRNLEMTRQLETRIRENLARFEARQLSFR